MRDVCGEEGTVKAKAWDEEVPTYVSERLREIIGNLSELKQIEFPRNIQSSANSLKAPWLLVFGDGSCEAYCAVAYARWELPSGKAERRVISAKTRVTPKKKISIPHVELMGALLAIRLAHKIRDTFQFQFARTCYFTDSSSVLGMLHKDSVRVGQSLFFEKSESLFFLLKRAKKRAKERFALFALFRSF